MIRGAVLPLGAIAALAGLAASRADEVSLASWPLVSPALPAVTEVFPRLPENWRDLPLQLHMTESAGYNSNFLNIPTGAGASAFARGRPVGAMQSISTYGASFKNEVGGQQFFADGSWGMYRYLNNDRYNTAHSSADIGDNFTYGSKCAGSLKASYNSAPSLPGQQLGVNVINTLTTVSANENAKCFISGEFSGILNSGYTDSQNSAALDKVNNYRSVFVAAGVSYTISETNSLQVLATLTGTDYTNRQAAVNTTGLVEKLTTDQIMATYTKNFGPNLALSAQFGVLGHENDYFGVGVPKGIVPQYSFNVQWAATPKLSLTAAVSRLASAPTTVLSNLQITENATAGFAYRATPKVTVGGNIVATYSTGAATRAFVSTILNTYTQSQRTFGGGANVKYEISPFLTANLSYQYTRSVQSTLTYNTSLILLALNFNPY